ncbi:helix-turn-helix domain-containing protein [Spiroplasma endosymbiont of 'Nebria riversi']|uniref:helix-turn-helix domain-containing protein n=1 Tax=Spiroplasma endosymbiont of 'Nebria riversi' TaxID=2792084 RepID=UPI001C045ACA|nr:helix-turn-helix domain-containing protein [Spiroplasma endosymbiont of 'Nebria riversi']
MTVYIKSVQKRAAIPEYGISKSAVYQWIENFNNFGSFKVQDNRTVEENELIYLRKKTNNYEWKMTF